MQGMRTREPQQQQRRGMASSGTARRSLQVRARGSERRVDSFGTPSDWVCVPVAGVGFGSHPPPPYMAPIHCLFPPS
jgi:hypothetical protein